MMLRLHTAGSSALMILGMLLMALVLGAAGLGRGGLPTSILDGSALICAAVFFAGAKLMRRGPNLRSERIRTSRMAVKAVAASAGLIALLTSSLIALLAPGSEFARTALPVTLSTMVLGTVVVVLTPLG